MHNFLKLFIFFAFAFLSFHVSAQDKMYDDYEKKAIALMDKIKSKTITEEDKKELSTIAFGFQNHGQHIDELDHDFPNSLKFVDKAIVFFTCLNDTINVANNKKFKGYLLGRLKRFPEAKAEVKNAIELYASANRSNGVAVSQFDMSRVYDLENNIDSAIYYCNLSNDYWKKMNDSFRVFSNKNMMIHLLTKKGDIANARSIQAEAEKYNAASKFHWLPVIDFYTVSIHLFNAANEKQMADHYKKLYHDKITELKKQKNIEAHSYYENE